VMKISVVVVFIVTLATQVGGIFPRNVGNLAIILAVLFLRSDIRVKNVLVRD
jgi:hypothetical protein